MNFKKWVKSIQNAGYNGNMYVISDLVFKKLPNMAKFTKFLTSVCNQLILITVKFIYYLNVMFVLI